MKRLCRERLMIIIHRRFCQGFKNEKKKNREIFLAASANLSRERRG
jgi:hypothetical protein